MAPRPPPEPYMYSDYPPNVPMYAPPAPPRTPPPSAERKERVSSAQTSFTHYQHAAPSSNSRPPSGYAAPPTAPSPTTRVGDGTHHQQQAPSEDLDKVSPLALLSPSFTDTFPAVSPGDERDPWTRRSGSDLCLAIVSTTTAAVRSAPASCVVSTCAQLFKRQLSSSFEQVGGKVQRLGGTPDGGGVPSASGLAVSRATQVVPSSPRVDTRHVRIRHQSLVDVQWPAVRLPRPSRRLPTTSIGAPNSRVRVRHNLSVHPLRPVKQPSFPRICAAQPPQRLVARPLHPSLVRLVRPRRVRTASRVQLRAFTTSHTATVSSPTAVCVHARLELS